MTLPHASVLSGPQNTVSVIISCKTCISGSVENTVWDPEYGVCSDTPRFSYGWSETRVRAVSTRVSDVYGHAGTGWVWYRVGILGGLYRVGNTGSSNAKRAHVKRRFRQRSGSRKSLQEAEWMVWTAAPRPRTLHPPSGPGPAPAGHSLVQGPLPVSGPITARFDLIFHKVSQNGIVSPKMSHKACHSPCSQNRVQKSALEILRFPILRAFSHKELMGHFDA